MCERIAEEASVAPAGAEPAAVRLQDDDVAARIVGQRVMCRPQTREPTSDDHQIGIDGLAQRRVSVTLGERVLPVRMTVRVAVGGAVALGRGGRRPGWCHRRVGCGGYASDRTYIERSEIGKCARWSSRRKANRLHSHR